MTIQLNLPALERLLGGDTELEVQLRQQVVEAFARKRLKTLINDETHRRFYAEWESNIRTIVNEELRELLQTKKDEIGVATTMTDYSIRNLVSPAVAKAVDDAVEKALERWKLYLTTDAYRVAQRVVDEALKREIEKAVVEGIQRRLDAARVLEAPAKT